MKRFLLMMSLLPCFVIAQGMPERAKRIMVPLMMKQVQRSVLRSDQPAVLDSVYNFRGNPGQLSNITRFTYDEQGRCATETIAHHEWTPSGSFSRTEYTYIENQTEPSVLTSYYQRAGEESKPNWKREYDYNEFGKMTEIRIYEYEEGEWFLSDKTTMTAFNEKGDFTACIDSIFEGGELQIFRTEAVYAEDNKTIDVDFYFWQDAEQIWRYVQRTIVKRDDHLNVIADIAYERYDSEELRPYYEIYYTYDERNNQIGEYEISHDGTGDSYFYSRLQNFYSDGLICDYPSIYTDYQTTANQEMSIKSVQIYQNALERSLVIDLGNQSKGKLSVIGLSGKLVRQHILNGSFNEVSLSNLSSGVYLIRVETLQGVKVEKILLQ